MAAPAPHAEPRATHDAAVPLGIARALDDPLRLRIVELLASEQLCVSHLAAELHIPQPLVSHHLKGLRDAGLLASDRYRYWTYYRLRPDALLELATRLRGLATQAPSGVACRRPPTGTPAGRQANSPRGIQLARDRQLDPISRRTFAAAIESLASAHSPKPKGTS